MKVLVVGGGGREHSLVWKIAESDLVEEVVAAPGSDGIAKTPKCRCEPVSGEDVDGQIALAKKEQIDLVVVGPEAPLVAGLADRLQAEGILVFGPSAAAAQLEGSKVFSKEFMARHDIPTAAFSVHRDSASAVAEVNRRNGPCVVKADGLAAGKGVIVCADPVEARKAVKEMLEDKRFGSAGDTIIIEDCLVGEEASVLAICDGERVVPLIAAQDHKAAFEGDTGPNTGGMGAYAPAPVVTDEIKNAVLEKVLIPTVKGMAEEGMPFKGVLYAGIMITDDEINVLEFNVRFGDPECQPLMVFLKEDIVPVLKQAAEGSLEERELTWHEGSTMCVVIASEGYPGSYEKGRVMSGLDSADDNPKVTIFHAGTKLDGDTFVTAGGRVLGVTARGEDIQDAAKEAYAVANKISFEGMRMRRDIGYRAL
jgi:phosphoribosylamine--glycine ligase